MAQSINGVNGVEIHNQPTSAIESDVSPVRSGKSRINATNDMRELGRIISEATEIFSKRLGSIEHSEPNMSDPFPPPLVDAAAQAAKLDIIRACDKLMALVTDPVLWLMHQNMSFIYPASVSTALRLRLFDHVDPGETPTSLATIAERSGADMDLIERILRVLTQIYCFEEVSKGQFRHNGVSSSLLVPPLASLIDFCCDDGFKAAAFMSDTLEAENWQTVADPSRSAFSKAFGTSLGMFDHYKIEQPSKGDRFAFAMAGSEVVKPLTEDIYPFHKLPTGARVVDVGGGLGSVSARIAAKIDHIKFVVQDQPDVVEVAVDMGMDEELQKRVEFQSHDFFQEQPVKGADVYLLRFILHDHPDK